MIPVLALAAEGGFDPTDPSGSGGLFWTVVIFVVAMPFMWKVVMGPISQALGERDEQASRAITLAEQASADAEKARAEVEIKLGEARAEAAQMLSQARERGASREREIVDAANAEARAMVEAARRTIRAEQEKAISAIRDEVVELSLSAASKLLERKVDSDDDRHLVEGMVTRMRS